MIKQLPSPARVTVAPDTVQTEGVFEVKVTVRPELAVAVTENGAAPDITLFSEPKLIVCDPGVTLKLCDTDAATA